MLIYVGLCWFMLVYVGLCWFMLVYVGLCWFMLVYTFCDLRSLRTLQISILALGQFTSEAFFAPFHLGEFPLVTRGLELADIGPTLSEPKTHGEPILNSDSHWQSLNMCCLMFLEIRDSLPQNHQCVL
jgi:hypothetical protein